MRVTVGNTGYEVVLWNPTMAVMTADPSDPVIAIDTETEMLDPAKPVVPVLQQVCNLALKTVHLINWDQMQFYNHCMFKDPGTLWVLHNAPFDLNVMGLGTPGKEY